MEENKKITKVPKTIPSVIDPAQEQKEIFNAKFRESINIRLKECFSLSPYLAPDEMAFIREVKEKFIQKQNVTIKEAGQLNVILNRARGSRSIESSKIDEIR